VLVKFNEQMRCATIDTNTFIYAYLNKIDIFDLLEAAGIRNILIPSKLIDELKILENRLSGNERIAVRFAINLVKTKCRIVEVNATDVDASLLHLAKDSGCVLITSDRDLIDRAASMGVETAYIRSKRKLEFRTGYKY